ncbi:MAG: hypothetical protein A3F84_27715 [Candidatus Handelsmanbacteria bacterium RIFCSPLOWO2_12_FULL_64_10]|uniref:Uncharacterized protein n=1 Tax=Handelsmanbacteria sp. (strain RIFCSPLOWO2_12_FULL_64_10) TaxID=1817868 RepID=A0A1F6C4Z7_HANXR|nr:MAG: hypothetical protein A3F84_27715 [Candidatus Handelsmanbacteria bacterium RIFCSPLOWO2_12_FULL_64_10]
MQVRLLTDRSAGGSTQYEGDVIDLLDAEAVRLIGAGQAEAAMVTAPENAARSIQPKPRKGR